MNEFSFRKKSRILFGFAVVRVLPRNTWVYLQYSSSFSLFRIIWIFSRFWNFYKGIGVLWKTRFFKNVSNS
jgi:hypothetical protein